MPTLLRRIASLLFVLALGACASSPSVSRGADYFPGGSQFYSYGVSQSKENFANIERAQSDYSLYPGQRSWAETTPGRSPSEFNLLQAYYLLSVRWQLKDGRQFIAENIDVRTVMSNYFKTNRLDLPYQREKRPSVAGDYDPSFVHEVKGDSVVLKWLVRNNRTPLARRANELPKIEYEEYVVTTIQGTPTAGIDFNNRRDPKK